MDDILKEAIADAKALRATALENAKIALEEAFTPRLKNMLSQKIQSEVEHEDEVEEDAYSEEEVEDGHEEVSEEDAVEPELSDEDEHGEAELSDEDEDELDLESVIKELEEELDTSAVGDAENKEPSDSASDSSEIGQGPEAEGSDEEGGKENSEDEVVKEPVTEAEESELSDEDEEIDLDEVIKALDEEEADDNEGEKVEELQSTLKEYKDTIGFLREKLNEVNLLNAKLLFTNKLFRGFGLNNNQKLQVVEQFDRTKNLREIKLVYATLAESFKGTNKPRVNENKGQASKAVQSTAPKKEVLSEGIEMRDRFKKLANLI